MNLYVLVEGKTERKIYPKFLSYFLPNFSRVDYPGDVENNNYYLISGGGYPSLLDNHLVSSIQEMTEINNFQMLLMVLDTDGNSSEEKINEVLSYIQDKEIEIKGFELVIIPQNICIETWFLGNPRVYSKNPNSLEFQRFSSHYDVSVEDPEEMRKYDGYNGTEADFHYKYLKEMLKNRSVNYTKNNPREVGESYYIKELENRLGTNSLQLNSMGYFFNVLRRIGVS